MHTIGCPATSFFLPKLKNALVWTTDPLPPAVRSGVRDLEACLRWEKREKTEGERERVSVFVRVDARKYKTCLEICFSSNFFCTSSKSPSRLERNATRDFEDERDRAHTQKKGSATWLTHRKHVFLDQEVWLRDECAGSSHFYINSLWWWCVSSEECVFLTRISFGFCGSKRTKKKQEKKKGKKIQVHSKSQVTRLCRRRVDTRFHKRWLLLSWNRYISLIPS